jgi:hypothetical protein
VHHGKKANSSDVESAPSAGSIHICNLLYCLNVCSKQPTACTAVRLHEANCMCDMLQAFLPFEENLADDVELAFAHVDFYDMDKE